MPLTKTLILRRRGVFSLRRAGGFRCGGAATSVTPVNYRLEVVCGCILDHRGFLFEQLDIASFFSNKEKENATPLSCEMLVQKYHKEIKQLILDQHEKCKILRMELTISPYPHEASITYTEEPYI